MESTADLNNVKRRAYSAIEQDGLEGIHVGLMFIFFALFLYGTGEAMQHGHPVNVYCLVLPIIGCAMQTVVKPFFRKRFTYPRVGFAKFIQQNETSVVLLQLLGAVIALGVMALFIWVEAIQWLLPLYLAVVLVVLTLNEARKRGRLTTGDYIVTALYLAGGSAGLFMILLGIHPLKATAYELWGLTAIFVSAGFIQFARFLHKYPRVTQEASADVN